MTTLHEATEAQLEARLAAAAPELVEALRDIQTQARNRIKDGDEMGARCWRIGLVDILAEADALLARIEGETQ